MTMTTMSEVEVPALPLERLAGLLEPDRAARLMEYAARARQVIGDRVVWNVNATAAGGGVAEMLFALLAYGRGAGVDTRWRVLSGDPAFFLVTKRIHNFLHGSVGDGGGLGERERRHYEEVLAANAARLLEEVRPGDFVLLHDPQTAGLAPTLADAGAHVIWRSHIGWDLSNLATRSAWSFLRPYVESADAVIVSRAAYAPDWIAPVDVFVIPPSLDPFSPKNCELTSAQVDATLRAAGIVSGDVRAADLGFTRRDGTPGTTRRHSGVLLGGDLLPAQARLVLQVSRWDRLKDMTGVLTGFVSALDSLPDDVHLVLAGPRPEGVSDDPEGARVAEECLVSWLELPDRARRRVHLCSVPMDDLDENAHIINALQRRADVVVQKSLAEGFGLTVTEPMWKGRAVVASRVGGIQDQVVDGESGVLVEPHDLEQLGAAISLMMHDDDLRARLGAAAHERVRDRYLGDRHLIQYVDLFATLLDRAGPSRGAG